MMVKAFFVGKGKNAGRNPAIPGRNIMKKLSVYLKGYRRQSVLAPLFKLLEALMDLFVPIVVANLIDIGIRGNIKAVITKDFLLMLALAAAGLLFSITAQYFAANASVGFASNLRQALFDHVQSLSYKELDTLGTNTLITRMTSDVQQVQNGLNLALRLLLRSPFIVFGSMIMAFTIDVRCALIFAVAIPVLSVVVFGIMLVSIPLFRKVQAALDKVLGLTRENLTGVRVIRAFCKEDREVGKFEEANEALTKINLFVGRISAVMNPATYFLINLATIYLIREGAVRVNMGSIQQGQVVALYNYMAQMIIELIKLASLIISINKALACADRIENILEVKPGMDYPQEDSTAPSADGETAPAAAKAACGDEEKAPAVEFRSVSFTYEGGGAPALAGITFTVHKGQTVGIIGGTGSGKTTLVNLIPRFYDVTEGAVLIDGKDVRSFREGELTGKIGVVPQRSVLFEGTIRDNMRFGNPDATDEDIWKALETAQAKEIVEGKQGQLDAPVEQNGRNFSGGQKQRLTIARAIVRHPEILIMDDSASALDFATDARLRQAVHDLEGSMTVFIVSQRTSSIRNADLIIVLDDGAAVGQGTHDELMQSCETYREIYYSQFPEERPENKVKAVAGAAGKEALA